MTANNRLKAMFSLKSKITVYIPATVNINETIDNTEFVNKAATLLSECFGGATSTGSGLLGIRYRRTCKRKYYNGICICRRG